MVNLFEMMLQAQGGQGVNNIARQFGLNMEQTQSALQALLPAFSLGMQRQAESLDGLQGLMKMFGGGQFAGFHDANGDGIPDNAASAGTNVLGQLFGSKEMSRAIAAQASMMTGISDAILKQMMPIVAAMLMGGLFKTAMGNGLGGLMGQAMQGGLQQMMQQGMTGFGQPAQPTNPGGLMGNMLNQMFGGLMGGQPQPQPQPTDPVLAGFDMLKGMFDSGQQVSDAYQANLQSAFEQFMKPRA